MMNDEPVLAACPYCGGSHNVEQVEQCPMRPSHLRRMDEAAITASIALHTAIQSLKVLQRLYLDNFPTDAYAPDNPLNLLKDIRSVEQVEYKVNALKDVEHRP